jgi:multidrug efflux pump subunit AcrA (membrane-fusion protein)
MDGSLATLEADRTSLTVERHQLDAAAAEILRAKDNLSYTTILSPIDGIVTRMNAKVGEMVVTGTMNNMGTVILEVSDLSEMQVDAQIDETNIANVKSGQKGKVRISAFPDQLFDGVVKLVGWMLRIHASAGREQLRRRQPSSRGAITARRSSSTPRASAFRRACRPTSTSKPSGTPT